MDGGPGDSGDAAPRSSKSLSATLWVLGFIALLVTAFTLEDEVGIPFATTLRVACVGLCLFLIYEIGREYPGEQWPWISLWIALAVDIAIFFTPLVDRPASRGELMLFAAPDAVVVLAARIATYRVTDVHQRATRQTMILGLIVALVFCAVMFALALVDPRIGHGAKY